MLSPCFATPVPSLTSTTERVTAYNFSFSKYVPQVGRQLPSSPECIQATFHSENIPYCSQPGHQPIRELASSPATKPAAKVQRDISGTSSPPIWPSLVEREGRHLGNKAGWSPSSSFYFCHFHFPSHQKSPCGGVLSPLPSRTFPPHWSPDTAAGPDPLYLLLSVFTS